MVRTYLKKSNRTEISEEAVVQALRDLRNGNGSVREVANRYNLTKSMLHKRFKKINENNQIDIDFPHRYFSSKYASRQIFTKDEEDQLEKYLIHSSKLHYGLTYYQTRQFAHEYAVRLEKNIPAPWRENNIAGLEWVKGFMKRHPQLSLRKPESTSLARNINFNKTNVNLFFNNLEKVFAKYNFSSERIVNVDESGVNTVLQMPKVVANKGIKQVGQAVGAERGEQVTFCGIILANGNTIPPAYVFPRVRFKESFLTGAPEGSIGIASPKGWMTNEGFLAVIAHIKKYTYACKENPVLVLLDNHYTHASLELILYCRENGLVLLTFPPHTTHRLQPLDICVFGPFKTRCRASFNEWMSKHPGKAITIYDIAYITAKPFNETFNRHNIISGFLKSGCYPLNKNIFTEDDFVSAQVTEQPFSISENTTAPSERSSSEPSTHVTVEENNIHIPSTSTTVLTKPTTMGCHKINIISSIILPSVIKTSNACDKITAVGNKPAPEDIRPFPKAVRPTSKKISKRKKSSAILTETPEKNRIEQEILERELKKSSKKKKSKTEHIRKVFAEETSESEIENIYQESDDSPMEDEETDIDWDGYSLDINDFILVKFATKKTLKHFVGQIVDKNGRREYLVNFLKVTSGQKFIFPDRKDESLVTLEDIVLKLPPPIQKAGTARSNAFFKFRINFLGYNLEYVS